MTWVREAPLAAKVEVVPAVSQNDVMKFPGVSFKFTIRGDPITVTFVGNTPLLRKLQADLDKAITLALRNARKR